ncbi:hypothetical protein GCM10027037_20570 [Mucilaginibacter koreensis]
MRRNIWNKLLLIAVLAVLASCKARKQAVVINKPKVAEKPAANPMIAKLAAIRANQIDFNTFSGKAKTKLDINGKSNDVTLNIRIQKNQRIWVSITALLGVEVARALITPDSIQVINRLQSIYLKKPFSYIYNYAGRQVNYKTVESLLIGNAIPELVNDANVQLQTGTNGNTVLSGNLQSLIYQLTLNQGYRVTQTNLSNQAAGQSLQVANSEFVQADGKVVPSQINIKSEVKNNNIQADLRYSRTEFNQVLEYPFSIPSRFSPAD